MSRRIIVLLVEDTQASEDLIFAFDVARQPPWRPNKPPARFGDPQVRYSEGECDEWILKRLRSAAQKMTLISQSIIPDATR